MRKLKKVQILKKKDGWTSRGYVSFCPYIHLQNEDHVVGFIEYKSCISRSLHSRQPDRNEDAAIPTRKSERNTEKERVGYVLCGQCNEFFKFSSK